MKIITAIENKKINDQLKKINNINIMNSDIQYKEGILEYLEKNKKLDLIILKENLPGQIIILDLIKEIQKINNEIKIVIIINNNYHKDYKNIKNVHYIYLEKININNIFKLLNLEQQNIKDNINKIENNIIQILGHSGSGKTTMSAILIKIISQIKKEKVLVIDEDRNKILSNLLLNNNYKNIINEKEIINLEKNSYLLNLNYIINNKINIIDFLNKIKNDYDFIIIDGKNKFNNFEKIINKKLYLLEANLIEIEKSKKYIKKNNTEIIINKKNMYSIDKKIIKNIFNKKILLEINYNKNINLFINNNFNLKYLDKKIIFKLLKIID